MHPHMPCCLCTVQHSLTYCSWVITLEGLAHCGHMAPRHSPTVRLRRLARELRQTRQDLDLSPEAVAAQLGWSRPKLNRIENGKTKLKLTDVAAICDLYGVDSAKRAALIQLAREAHQRGWWAAYGDVFSGSYIGLEDEAVEIREWGPQVIPGLLQTEDYARQVIRAGRFDLTEEDVDRRIQARMARKTLLSRPTPPKLHVVLDEAVLRRQVGGPDVMRDQLIHLRSAARREHVRIQILPFEVGTHVALEGPFIVLSFAEPGDPDTAYIETKGGDIHVEAAAQVSFIRVSFDKVAKQALSEEDSAMMLAASIEE